MIHINDLKFEGETPWVKAMNKANYYYERYCDDAMTEAERNNAYESWCQIRYEIESGIHENNS